MHGEARARALGHPLDAAIPEHWLDSLEASIAHRGPDGRGRFRDRSIARDGTIVDVALVHRRLSIIDHADGGQPMVTLHARKDRDGTLARPSEADIEQLPPPQIFVGGVRDPVRYRTHRIEPWRSLRATVFNGCVYNHTQMRADLQSRGAEFTTDHSDTEVIPHALHEWGMEGDGAIDRLDAMFAIASWNHDDASLVLSVDRFGEKPLYTTTAELPGTGGVQRIAFASIAAGVAPFVIEGATEGRTPAQSAAAGEPHEQSWHEAHAQRAPRHWLRFGFEANPPLPGIQAELPSTAMIYEGMTRTRTDHRGLSQPDLCDPSDAKRLCQGFLSPRRTATLHAIQTLELIRDAVRSRLIADVPIACFLSGGVDSSLIAALASRHQPALQSVNVKMPDSAIDESEHARAVAKHLGLRHTEVLADASVTGDPAADLTTLIAQSGVPLGDSSLLASLWVSRAASQVAKVALGGDGGDELFAGYERYRASAMFYAAGPLRYAGLIAGSWPPPNADARGLRRWRALNAAAHDGYADLLSIFPRTMLDKLWPVSRAWSRDARRDYDTGAVASDRASLFPGLSKSESIATAIASDTWAYLPYDLLRKVDTASMSVPLEVRSPMLARALSDAALRAPIRDLMPGGERKGLLRAVARTLLPASVIDRPKQGFAAPIASWLRSDVGGLQTLARERLLGASPFGDSIAPGIIREPVIRRLIDEHAAGTHDHAQRIYCLLTMSLWASWRSTIRPIGN